MTYLTIINPESNGDEPGERLMAPSAGYTCSDTKLWPNRRPRSPMSKINTAPSPVALCAVHGGDTTTCSPTTMLIMRIIGGGGRRRPSFAPFFIPISHFVLFNGCTSAATQRCRWCDLLKSSSQPVSPFISADPFGKGGDGESAHLGISQHTGAI